MSEQVTVRHTELVTHAGHVEAVAGRLATAAGAARVVRADNGAYGQLCVMVPAMLNVLHDILIDGLDECAESLRDTGAKLRTTAAEYNETDILNAQSLKGAG